MPIQVGDAFGRNRVTGREGTTGPPGYRPLWRVVCAPDLGGCGAVRLLRADNLRRGDAACLSCAVTTSPPRVARIRAHAATLTQPIWPHTCPTCGTDFLGTARQVYCRPEHRPSRPTPED